jgi:hypothetical protein
MIIMTGDNLMPPVPPLPPELPMLVGRGAEGGRDDPPEEVGRWGDSRRRWGASARRRSAGLVWVSRLRLVLTVGLSAFLAIGCFPLQVLVFGL